MYIYLSLVRIEENFDMSNFLMTSLSSINHTYMVSSINPSTYVAYISKWRLV